MASNSKNSTEEESNDLSTCCICMEHYDGLEGKPKFLPCHHTYCLKCIKIMVKAPASQLTCPKCKKNCQLNKKEADNLTTNVYALNIIQLKNVVKNQNCWCLDCGSIAKEGCEVNHSVLDRMEDVEEIKALLTEVSNHSSQAIKKRQQIDEFLQTAIADNEDSLVKLRSLSGDKQLLAGSKTGAVSAKKKLKETLKKMKREVEEADRLWNKLNGIVNTKNDVGYSSAPPPAYKKGKLQRNSTADGGFVSAGSYLPYHSSSLYQFPPNGISAERFSSSEPMECRELNVDHHSCKCITAINFSADVSYFVSGNDYGRVLLWPTNKVISGEAFDPSPMVIETKHSVEIWDLAFSPDNERIFSCSTDKKLLVHDTNTHKLFQSFEHPNSVYSVSLQPGTGGKLFVTACEDGFFRLFDTRHGGTDDAVSRTAKRPGTTFSSIFSPTDQNILVASGNEDGVILYDVRNLKRCLYSIPGASGTWGAALNGSGTHLLCCENLPSQLVVYELPTRQQPTSASGKILLTAPDFSNEDITPYSWCFAGLQDELVVSGSNDGGLYIWSLTSDHEQDYQTIDEPIKIITDIHHSEINCLSYNSFKSALLSCGDDGAIKLWTSGTQL